MTRNNDWDRLLLSVWPAVCRQEGIHAATAAVAELLAPRLPLRAILVRRVNISPGCLETVAVAAVGRAAACRMERADCSPEQMKGVLSWCARGEVLHGRRGHLSAGLRVLAPSRIRGDLLVGALRGPSEPVGVLILVADAQQPFAPADERLLAALLPPFSAALLMDRRLHELAQLREAAEADRRALLAKLGRTNVTTPIVGAEAGLRPVMGRVAMVAGSDVPVLLFGETGTGKEVIARAIHEHSPRAEGPFIRVNCGAIPSELIDSQLFGHEQGSFTGATESRQGWFERADGGTLFLDEIGDLPLAAQVRLLRVLQDGSLERVGGQQALHVDVRVVGATHRDLAAMMHDGKFRDDLWYRLAVFPVAIPPLRERPEDIAALARHFAEKAATRFGLPLVMPTARDVHLLMGYAWPGNVRELAAVVDRAALLGNGRRLAIGVALGDGPATWGKARVPGGRGGDSQEAGLAPAAEVTAPATAGPNGPGDGQTLDGAMVACIETALRDSHGRVEGPFGAAARLGVNPHTLRSRMRRLKIDWRRFRS